MNRTVCARVLGLVASALVCCAGYLFFVVTAQHSHL